MSWDLGSLGGEFIIQPLSALTSEQSLSPVDSSIMASLIPIPSFHQIDPILVLYFP